MVHLVRDTARLRVVDHLVGVIVHGSHLDIPRPAFLPDVVLDSVEMASLLALGKLLLQLLYK